MKFLSEVFVHLLNNGLKGVAHRGEKSCCGRACESPLHPAAGDP